LPQTAFGGATFIQDVAPCSFVRAGFFAVSDHRVWEQVESGNYLAPPGAPKQCECRFETQMRTIDLGEMGA